MENCNNNKNRKGGYFDQYVNFDQFLMQHNINNWSPHRGSENGGYGFGQDSYGASNSSSSHFQSHNGPSISGEYRPPSDWLQSSNLTPTAAEFVPQSASTLVPTANEFVPRNSQKAKEATNKQSNTVVCDMDKNDRIAPKDENASKTDSVIEALSKTHISDSTTRPLNSSGGAIKKVRNQDYRDTDSRDRHSNGRF